MKLGYMSTLLLLALAPFLASAVPVPEVEDNEVTGRSAEDANWKLVMKLIDDCSEQDMATCLGVKAIAVLQRAGRMASIDVMDGVSFVKTVEDADARALTEAELSNTLEQEPTNKMARLFNMFVESVAKLLKTHSLQMKLPGGIPDQIQRALDEGRGKKKLLKSLLPILLGVGGKLLLLIPAGIGLVGLIATKALLISKLALLLAGAIAIQKLVSGGGLGGLGGKNGWSSGISSGGGGGGGWSSGGISSGGSGGWSSGTGGSSGGWYRSLDGVDAHDLAYKAQAPDETKSSTQ